MPFPVYALQLSRSPARLSAVFLVSALSAAACVPPASPESTQPAPQPTFSRGHAHAAAADPSGLDHAVRDYAAHDLGCAVDGVTVEHIWGSHLIADGCGQRAVYMREAASVYLLSIVPLKE